MTAIVHFDGLNRVIAVDNDEGGPVTSVSAVNLYSAWKRWVVDGDGSQWAEAFGNSIGGETISADAQVDAYIFINNAAGWRIMPPDRDGELTITGNLYQVDPSEQTFISRPDRTISITLDRAAASQAVEVPGAAEDIARLSAERVWDAQMSDHQIDGSFGQRVLNILNGVRGLFGR